MRNRQRPSCAREFRGNNTRMTKTIARLPRIVRYIDRVDAGGGASCPHCGATGRYIFTAEVQDEQGSRRRIGAMAGCIKLFPVAPIAREHAAYLEKLARYERNGWKGLPSWDRDALDAIEAFYAGTMSETLALATVRAARARAKTWRTMRGRR